ncbi:MAG: hypothetical protein ACP6KW_10165 [Candidatus Thorarchaeota archaeon]
MQKMNRRKKAVLAIPLIVVMALLAHSTLLGISPGFESPALEFPILESGDVERLAAYHTPDWGEPGVFHNGIDLIISNNVTIVAPVQGTIVSVGEQINPYAGNTLFEITVAINWGWQVKLVLEPGFLDAANNSLQHDMIDAVSGQRVVPGDELATLLYSNNYAHLHYMLLRYGQDVCAYNYSTAAAKTIFDTIASTSNSTITYPYSEPNVLSSPMVIVPAAAIGAYVLLVYVVFRRFP